MKPLAGVTVLDFSRVLAGPMATMILADLGAEVIKIERPGSGDESRHWEPRVGEDSAYYFAFNRGKKSLALDLKSDAGREIARALAGKADILLENFVPGSMQSLGLDYARLRQSNPGLIYVSNSGFGQDGPFRDRKGYDTIFQALGGLMHLTGQPDGPPAKAGLPMADLTCGLWLAIACLTGLAGRATSGHGCYVDLSMLDVQASLLTIAAARLFALGEDPQRTGTEHPGRVPSAAFACADGKWVHISASDQHWSVLCETLGLSRLQGDVTLNKNAGRVAARERVMSAMREAISCIDSADLVAALMQADVPVGQVQSVRDLLESEHAVARGAVGSFDHPRAGKFKSLRNPMRITGYDEPEITTPPDLGADGEDILKSKLGLDSAAIAELRERQVIG